MQEVLRTDLLAEAGSPVRHNHNDLKLANMFGQSYVITEGGPGEATQTAVMYIAEVMDLFTGMGRRGGDELRLAFFLVVISILFFVFCGERSIEE